MDEIWFRAWHGGHKYAKPQMLYDEKPGDCLVWKNQGQNIECIMQYSGMTDEGKVKIYRKDILQIETQDRQTINVICEHGIVRRKMASGYEVDIPSFYFQRHDGLKSFPIVNNWAGKHDLEIIEVIGNVFEHNAIGMNIG